MGRRNHRGYTRRSVVQWERIVGEQQKSSLSQRAFCAERGVAYSSFCHWKRRLAETGGTPRGESEFIELEFEPAASEQWDVELTLGAGVVLRVRRR